MSLARSLQARTKKEEEEVESKPCEIAESEDGGIWTIVSSSIAKFVKNKFETDRRNFSVKQSLIVFTFFLLLSGNELFDMDLYGSIKIRTTISVNNRAPALRESASLLLFEI